jgi:hypothetical protein
VFNSLVSYNGFVAIVNDGSLQVTNTTVARNRATGI